MSRFQQVSRGKLLVAILVLALVFVLVLLALPLAASVEPLLQMGLVARALGHKKLLAIAVLAVVLVIAGWLILGRRWRLLGLAAVLGVIGSLVLGVLVFQVKYPRADVYNTQRLRDGWQILLGREVAFSRYDPTPGLTLQRRAVERAAFPAIDVHFHLESLPDDVTPERLVAAMDAVGVAKIVNLGGLEGTFEKLNEKFRSKYPDRFIFFAKPNPGALELPDGAAKDLEWIKRAVRMGARGLKENKSFGMQQLDADHKIVPVDDARLDPLWDLAGRLGMPVLVHTGEPPAFWEPIDEHNERMEELLENPAWSLIGTKVPSRAELMQQRERLLARHPGTNFIGAHLGMNPDDLQYAASLLDKYPNYYVDMSSVVSELGRQPYSTRRFFIKYQDRILFGTDGGYGLQPGDDPKTGWSAERMFRSYFEFLETDNEYIDYPLKSITKQGMWAVYGIDLPRDVLEKIYVRNAERLIPTDESIMAKLAALPQ